MQELDVDPSFQNTGSDLKPDMGVFRGGGKGRVALSPEFSDLCSWKWKKEEKLAKSEVFQNIWHY